MSHSFVEGIKITDSRINDLTSELIFPVYDGPSASTRQTYSFNSASNSALTINCQIPNESIVVDSRVLLKSDLNLTITCGNVPASKQAFQYGVSDSLNSFPLQSLFLTSTLSINNANSATNVQDVLALIKLLEDVKNKDKRNSTSPDYVNEYFGMYSDAILTNSNPMGSYNETTFDNARIPNGAYPCSITVQHYINNVLTDNSLVSTSTSDTWTIYLSFKGLTEPFLCLSPFTASEYGHPGLLGLNNLALTIAIDSACKKVWSTGNSFVNQSGNGISSYITGISLGNPASSGLAFTNSKLLFNFLTLTELQYSKVSTRNVSPFYDYSRYISPASSSPIVAPNGTGTVTFPNLQLSQVPQLLVFALRVPMSQQNWGYTDSFLAIEQIAITFNNVSSILGSSDVTQLYNMSVDAGSHQSFYSFNGSANAIQSGNSVTIPTLGSYICINCARDLSLSTLISNGSIGQYNLSITITKFRNQFPFTIQPEGIIMCVNGGAFITENGSSSVFTSLLDRQMVLDAKKEEEPTSVVDEEVYRTEVGGRMHHGFAAVSKMVRRHRKKGHHSAAAEHEEGGRSRKHLSKSKSKLSKLLK